MKLFQPDELNRICSFRKAAGISDAKCLYEFLSINKDFICSTADTFTMEDLWLSEYYWLLAWITENNLQKDSGIQQQAYQLLEQMEYSIGRIDWAEIESIDAIFHFYDYSD